MSSTWRKALFLFEPCGAWLVQVEMFPFWALRGLTRSSLDVPFWALRGLTRSSRDGSFLSLAGLDSFKSNVSFLSLAGLFSFEPWGASLAYLYHVWFEVVEKENKPVRSALDDHGGDLGEMKQKSELWWSSLPTLRMLLSDSWAGNDSAQYLCA